MILRSFEGIIGQMVKDFSKVINQLNQAQRSAVETIEGPVMVVAGPGTGKTQVLSARIAQILRQTDTRPHSILALTYTDSAANTMRERLVKMIGRTGYYVKIMTFHAFCSSVIDSHPEYFSIDRDSEPLSQVERFALFEQILLDPSLELDVLKPLNQPLFYLRDVVGALSDLKREGVSKEALAKMIEEEERELSSEEGLTKSARESREKKIRKHRELLVLYSEYQRKLRESLRYDFDDMIALVVEAFAREPLLLREYQEELHYFLVDEYQDTNSSQNQILDLLASYWGEQANVFVVGDPNQAIYRFQGASVENALSFAKRYPSARVITLQEGYRCSQLLYDGAYGVIAHNQLTSSLSEKFPTLAQTLVSQHSGRLPIKIMTAASSTLELHGLVSEIKALIDQGVPKEEIAILFRHNRDAVDIQAALSSHNLAYDLDGGEDVLRSEGITQLITLAQLIRDLRSGADSEALFEVLAYQWVRVDKHLLMQLTRLAARERVSLYNVAMRDYQTLEKSFLAVEVGGQKHLPSRESLTELQEFLALLVKLGQRDYQEVFPSWFEQFLKETHYLDWSLDQPDKVERLINLQSLFNQIKGFASHNRHYRLDDFLQTLSTMQKHGLSIPAEDLNLSREAIYLSTVHKAKGREWPYVFIVNCRDGKWGNARKRELLPLPDQVLTQTDLSKKEQSEDERRLFFVALSRASQQAIISYATTDQSGSYEKATVASMFVEELRSALIDQPASLSEVEVEPTHQQALEELVARLSPAPALFSTKDKEQAFFRALTKHFSLSVTALNTYLSDKKAFVENVLLRVPRAKAEPMAFGTAIHASLEFANQSLLKSQELPDLESIYQVFNSSLERELITDTDLARRKKYGREVLELFLNSGFDRQSKLMAVERKFGSNTAPSVLGDIQLSGRIDRIDWLDEQKKLVRVVDYKTGDPKSVNFIEGKVASMNLSEREMALPEPIRGPYKRQLLFYKLLTDLDPTFKPTVTHGSFSFVEPNQSGKIIERSFELKNEDVELLKALIKEVMAEIRELEFLNL